MSTKWERFFHYKKDQYVEDACYFVSRLYLNDDYDIVELAKFFIREFDQADEYSPECLVFAKACDYDGAWIYAYAILDMNKEFDKYLELKVENRND